MAQTRVSSFSISLDGYGAGPDQRVDHPLGVGGPALHQWLYGTATFHRMLGSGDGTTGVDDDLAASGMANIGAWIMGRNMFGPVRGPWPDDSWQGWWGDVPPYHTEVFVLTHHPRESLAMQGGTTFHFVTDGIHAALDRARAAAQDRDIRIGGGVGVIRQYLQAGLIDALHLAVSAVFLGQGEHLFQGMDLARLGYEVSRRVESAEATHFMVARRAAGRTT